MNATCRQICHVGDAMLVYFKRGRQKLIAHAHVPIIEIVKVLKGVLPLDVKKNVAYDLVRDPSRYIESTLRISRLMGDSGSLVCFMPTRRSNLPC